MMTAGEANVTKATTNVDHQGARRASTQERRGCIRCGGFLVPYWVVSLMNDGGDVESLTNRCIQCGEISDPVVLRNRCSTSTRVGGKTMVKPRKLILADKE